MPLLSQEMPADVQPEPERETETPAEAKAREKAAKKADKEQKKKAQEEEADAKAAAVHATVSVIAKMKWTNPTLQHQTRQKVGGFLGLGADTKKEVAWSGVHRPIQEAVSAILDGDTDKDKKLKPEKTAKEGLVDTSSHPLTPNFFGGQYSPFVPIAALGAAITIGDRSQLTLGAMTLAGIVTAIQLNNPDCADRSLGGLKKSREEIAFDQAKDYLLAAVDNIGKLDVQKDGDKGGDDSDNDDDNVDNIHPKWFAPGVEKDKKAANIAASKTISILRAACPDQMEALAKLVKDNEQVRAAYDKLTELDVGKDRENEWKKLRYVRSELKLLDADKNSLKFGKHGEDASQVYLPWKKVEQTEVFQDRKNLKKFYEWTGSPS